ncbi:hypothetical protein C0584_03360 [Candidatus Parcubacteria bacterium]|nr:MAG: hypothetical protein C0584_03360 [Candidatus Parcubacteria bacterium]
MNNKEYDLVIVGAGLSGLKLAELLKGSELNILLIEKRDTIKTLTKNYFGTFLEYIDRWKLDKYLLYKCGWGMYSTETKYFNNLEGKSLCVLEMNAWAESLKLDCDISLNTQIVKTRREKNKIILIDKNDKEIVTRLVVDATGIAQTISSSLGIKKSKIDFLNYVYIMENHSLENQAEMFYFEDTDLTNCGGWFHTLEPGRCLVGCAEYTVPGSLGKIELKKRLDSYIRNFHPLNSYLKNAKVVEEFCMAGPTTTEHSSIAEDNYISMGDAAGAGGPFIGDGFRMAFAMADSAYSTIKTAFSLEDFSKKTLKIHAKNFKKEFGKWYKWSYLFRFVWVRYLTNTEMNLFAKNLKKLSDDDYYKILTSKFSPLILWRLFTLKIFVNVFKNFIIYHFLEPIGLAKIKRRPKVL